MKDKIPEAPKLVVGQKVNPLIASLPNHLKDPANYRKISQAIWETVQTTCTHSEIMEMAECKKCTGKMLERRLLLRKLGFKNPAQYHLWRKIHTEIIQRYPLVDWEKENEIRKAIIK